MSDAVIAYNGCKIKDIYLAAFLESLGFKSDVVPIPSPHLDEENAEFAFYVGLDGQEAQYIFDENLSQDAALAYFADLCIQIGDRQYHTSANNLFLALKKLRRALHEARIRG